MKITGTGQASSSTPARRSGRVEGKGEFGRQLKEVMDGGEVPVAQSAAPASAIDALLAAQSVGDATDQEGRRRAMERGEGILETLEALRRALLLGNVPRHTLTELTNLLRAGRSELLDPRLAALMDEIELRAAVELAKLERDG